ncbi:hypothetical protein Q7P35_006703 [Cladosporium inversicolor]
MRVPTAFESEEGQKMRRRNFPKGYAEMPEKQHNQLVCGLQEMYQQLRKASLWEGEPLDESSGRPLTHDILAALNFLEPNEEEFVEEPRSSPMRQEPEADAGDTSADCSQEISQPTPQMFSEPISSTQTTSTRSPSMVLSPTTPGPHHLPGQPELQQHIDPHRQPKQVLPAPSPPIQLDNLWDDPLYSFDASQMPLMTSSDSSADAANWSLQAQHLLPPLVTQLPDFRNENFSGHKRTTSLPRPSLCHDWLGNGIGFDSSDFMSDFHQLSPQDVTDIGLRQPKRSGSLS